MVTHSYGPTTRKRPKRRNPVCFYGSVTPFRRRRVVAIVSVLSLATFIAPLGGPALATSRSRSPSPPRLTTSWRTARCTATEGSVTQELDGALTGCFRVPPDQRADLRVALQAYVSSPTSTPSPTTTTTIGPATSTAQLTLSVSPSRVTPGESAIVTGHYLTGRPTHANDYTTLCWDGCLSGLQQEATPLHWITRSSFRATLRVPDAPWLTSHAGGVTVHALTAGRYAVGVQCLVVTSGCALRRAEASTYVTLVAPRPRRCLRDEACATLTLQSTAAQVGDVVRVTGFAPLVSVIGQPFGYNLTLTATSSPHPGPAFALTHVGQSKGGGEFILNLAPRTLAIRPGVTWAQLGAVHPRATSWSGVSPIDAVGPSAVAWCQPHGVTVSGARPHTVATTTVARALLGTDLRLFSASPSHPECVGVLVNPRTPATIYAEFDVAQNGSAPPVYLAGLVSMDGGATWRLVPTPHGLTPSDFSGFVLEGPRVAALFSGPSYNPTSSARQPVVTEVSGDGGAKWASANLTCPAVGPCVSFGPYLSGNCAMNGTAQPLLIGTTPGPARSPGSWSETSWVQTVDSCYSQELVATSPRALLLLDPSSPYPLLQSIDGGVSWRDVTLPTVKGQSVGVASSMSDSLLLTPNGSLVVTILNSTGSRQTMYLLAPRATAWCPFLTLKGSPSSDALAGPLRITSSDLVWAQNSYGANNLEVSHDHELPLGRVRC